jgi:hypothetical protein
MLNKNQKLKENILDVVRKDEERDEEFQLERNGWEIMTPEYFKQMGFDEQLIDSLTNRQYSGEGKYSLSNTDGERVDYIDGVYYLDLLETCARIVDPEYSCDKMGRGYRAGEALNALREAANGV